MPRKYIPVSADPIVIERATRGEVIRQRVNKIEAIEIIRRLARQQYHDGQIAHILNRPRRSVQRTRDVHGIPPGVSRRYGSRTLPVDAPTRPRELR